MEELFNYTKAKQDLKISVRWIDPRLRWTWEWEERVLLFCSNVSSGVFVSAHYFFFFEHSQKDTRLPSRMSRNKKSIPRLFFYVGYWCPSINRVVPGSKYSLC